MKKKNIIIILAIIILAGVLISNTMKKPEPKYTTADVIRGEVLQTVSATGAVEAAKKLDLNFVNSGKIKEINVKVGDHVESEDVLAKLDTLLLESQLEQARATLNVAAADINKLMEGATQEDARVSETAVENAKIALENAKQNLEDSKTGAERDIANAMASLDSSKTALNNANQSFENTKISNENNLSQDYDDAWDKIISSLLVAYDSLNTNKTVLENNSARDTLSVLNMQYLNDSSSSKIFAQESYNIAKNFVESIKSAKTYENIDEALKKTKTALENIRKTLSDTGNVLQATITSSKLSQTELDSLKGDISSARTSVNASISNITAASQNIASQKIANQTVLDNAQAAVNSAKSALSVAENSLSATQVSSAAKINISQNAIKSAEGALKQAEDQLALKLAGPRSSDVVAAKSQVRKAQANVDYIQEQINDSTLIAPQKGIVTEINGEVGELTSSAKYFVSLITADNFEIKANISEVDIAKVKIGNEVDITFDAFGLDKKFKGNVVRIDPAETEISGVIYYKVVTMFSGDAEIIKPGMTANLDIMTADKNNVVMIPFQALKEKDGQKYVKVFEDGKPKDVVVEIGLKGDVNLEVIEGLEEGQKVVTFVE